MSYSARLECLRAIVGRYRHASKQEKSKLLNHTQMITGLTRKQIIRWLNGSVEKMDEKKKRSGRPPRYEKKALIPHIRYLWIEMDRITPGRMKAALKDWLPSYRSCPGHLKFQLQKMSVSTLRRYLREIRQTSAVKKGIATTCPARFMKNKVPINTLDSKVNQPGFTQADTVSHCGNSAKGPFISSLTLTDIDSTWTETRAIASKKSPLIRRSFLNIENSLPIKILAINVDSGSEFLNRDMLMFTEAGRRIKFTRSRAYHKNDNCYIEQKNYTHVRELFGYERFEGEELVSLMNEIYINYWNPLQNFFLPSYKIKEKVRIGAKTVKKYDKPQTPYDRLMNSTHLSEEQKEALARRKQGLDPFELKQGLERKLKEFFEKKRQLEAGKQKEAA